jgi:hypothetical protein
MNNKKILDSAITQCNLHAKRIETALQHIHKLIPFSPEVLASLQDEDLGFLELLTSRLAKLQDTIGQKIFPNILVLLQEDITGKSFVDILNKLEKLQFLDSTETWKDIREIRNSIAHDYPENPKLVSENLNKAVIASRKLVAYWNTLQQQLQQRVINT